MVRLAVVVVALALLSCGARTGLSQEEREEDVCSVARDAGTPPLRSVCSSAPPPPCTPSGPELCNGLDDDCDGGIDEELALQWVGGPWIVRDEGDGRAGGCDECGDPQSSTLVERRGAPHVVWDFGFDPEAQRSNVFGRRLGRDGPEGPVEPIGDYTAMFVDSAETLASLLTVCERTGDFGQARWSVAGGPLQAPLGECEQRCVDSVVGSRNGRCHAIARVRTETVVLDIAGETGEPLATYDLWEPDRLMQLGIWTHEGTTAVVAGRENGGEARVFFWDPDGLRSRAVRVPDPGRGWRRPRIVRTDAGWLVLGASEELVAAVVQESGRIVQPPRAIGDAVIREFAATRQGPHRVAVVETTRDFSGTVFTTAVVVLDAEGRAVAPRLSAPDGLGWRFPSIHPIDDQLIVTYVVQQPSFTQVRAAALGCAR